MARSHCAMLAMLCALVSGVVSQTPPADDGAPAPEQILQEICSAATVVKINQTLLEDVLRDCGGNKTIDAPGFCDTCGCTGEPALTALATPIIAEKGLGDFSQLDEDCRLTMTLYVLAKANVTRDRTEEVSAACGLGSNKGLWNLDGLEAC